MSTNDNPIRILSDFTEEVKTYVVSSGGRLLDTISQPPESGSVGLPLDPTATLLYVENDASNITGEVLFLDDMLATITDGVYCPAGGAISVPIPEGASLALVNVDAADTGIIGLKTS